MSKPVKGERGYTDAHKKSQILKTVLFFLIPIAIFVLGYVSTDTRRNYFTILAIVGCLPACKEMVNVLMFLKRHSMPEELYREIESHAGNLERAYELVLTTYEKNYPVHSLVICGNEITGYTTMKNADLKPLQEHIVKMMKENGITGVHVHIFTELKTYLDRVDTLAKRKPEEIPFTPDERFPDLNREQCVRQLLLSLSL